MIKAVFFDVANTLVHKPAVFITIHKILVAQGYTVNLDTLRLRHKLLSEAIAFPDKTSAAFYMQFNRELLFSLGIVPNTELLNEIFTSCTYLPWETFADTDVIGRLSAPTGVISNWDTTLPEKLRQFFSFEFKWVLGSETLGARKPSAEFYQHLTRVTGLSPQEILYVGDSLKLDIEPAQRLGVRTLLIDRINAYPAAPWIIRDMHEILNHL